MKIDNITFCNSDQDMVVKSILNGEWENYSRIIWKRLVERLPTGAIVWDVGAYTGYYSLAAAQMRSDIDIYSFEPHPRLFEVLRCNIKENDFKNITPKNIGLGAINSEYNLNITNSIDLPSGSSLVDIGKPVIGRHPIKVCTADSFVAETEKLPDLIKIDVEGFEIDVIFGMVKTLMSNDVIILMEILNEQQYMKILNFLVSLGYYCSRINENGANFSAPFNSDDRNYLFYVNPDILRAL